MKVIAVVPARMASTRFPKKPLAPIAGLPMIEHVRRRTALCADIDEVVVATCDREIAEVVEGYGGKTIMTSPIHERCTERVAEAVDSLDGDIIINVQGDEPFVTPDMLSPLVRPLLEEPELPCANLISEIDEEEVFQSANVVKTVFDQVGNAIYFSREPIPSAKKAGDIKFKKYRQLGIIAFRKDFLKRFVELPPTPLEKIESVDMMRAIEHGYTVRTVLIANDVVGVDTPGDLEKAEVMMKGDALVSSYHSIG